MTTEQKIIKTKVGLLELVYRTSEFDARTTPEQSWSLDRQASPGKLLSP